MRKYKVYFEVKWTEQVDGWTDWQDTEYEIHKRTEIVTVEADNMVSAKRKALKKSKGYYTRDLHHWHKDQIKRVKHFPAARK